MESKTHEEGMTLNQYQTMAMMTCTYSCRNFSYMMLNLMGEVGEFASKVAKAIRKEEAHIGNTRPSSGQPSDSRLYFTCDSIDLADHLQHMKLEAGDILWQLAGLCDQMGWKLEDVAKANIHKLASRHERGKIIGDGDDR